MNPVHFLFKIDFNIIFPSTTMFPEVASFQVSFLKFCKDFHHLHVCYMSNPSHSPSLDQPNNI